MKHEHNMYDPPEKESAEDLNTSNSESSSGTIETSLTEKVCEADIKVILLAARLNLKSNLAFNKTASNTLAVSCFENVP